MRATRHCFASALAVQVGGWVTGCFVAPSLLGQPCVVDRDCDLGQRCRESTCVGSESEASTTFPEPATEEGSPESGTPLDERPLDRWLCSGATDATTNLTRNASFEAWAASDQPLYWHTSAQAERDTAYPFSGNAALRLSDLAPEVWQNIDGPFQAGTVFEARAAVRWERGELPSAISIRVGRDETWSVDAEVRVLGTGHWNREGFRFRLPVDVARLNIEVDCFFHCNGSVTVVLDDIELIVCEAPP